MDKYLIHGLCVHSEIQLPCAEKSDRSTIDVEIRKSWISWDNSFDKEGIISCGDESIRFHWKEVGTYLVRNGREIVIDAHPEADESLLGLPLVGPVISALLYQRGFCILHASSVCINGRAVAIVGHKGFGKSTTAAAMYERGHRLLTDDVLAMKVSESPVREVTAFPGLAKINLWPDSMELVNPAESSVFSLRPGGVKEAIRATRGFSTNAVNLKHIYFLGFGETNSLAHIPSREAFVEILPHTFMSRYIEDERSIGPKLLSSYSTIVGNTECFRLTRDPSNGALDQIARLIERNVERDLEAEPIAI